MKFATLNNNTPKIPNLQYLLDNWSQLIEEIKELYVKSEIPDILYHDPLMYQGCSDGFLAPTADICFTDAAYGIDFEAEIAIITDHVPMATPAKDAAKYIRLVMLANDVSLRNFKHTLRTNSKAEYYVASI